MGGGANRLSTKSTCIIGRSKKRCKTLCCKKKAKFFGFCKICWRLK